MASIAFIGLGNMGGPMAANLVKAGHKLSVWNRTASKADPLGQIGAEVVTDKTAMAHCATLFTMVSQTDDLKEILFGPDGVIGGGVLAGNGLLLFFAWQSAEVSAVRMLPPLLGTSAIMLTVGMLACIAPARRALRIQPIDALKES